MIIQDMFPRFLEQVRGVFERDKHHTSIFFLNLCDQVNIVAVMWKTNEDKEAMAENLIKLIKEDKLKEFAFVCEAWTGEGEEAMQEYRKHGTLKELPNRHEHLLIHYANPKDEYFWFAQINRDEKGNPTLDEWRKMEGMSPLESALMSTRFGRLWQKASIGVN